MLLGELEDWVEHGASFDVADVVACAKGKLNTYEALAFLNWGVAVGEFVATDDGVMWSGDAEYQESLPTSSTEA